MENKISGLVHITGEPDTGKTTLAIANGFNPSEICFFDDDLKTKAIAKMLEENGTPFGAYYNLTKLSNGMREIDFHNMVMQKINAIPKDKFKVIIFDTWERFEATFFPMVQSEPMKYRQFYSPMGAIKGAEQWKASFDYESSVIDGMLEKVQLVIIVTHLKNQNIGGARTGKLIPNEKKPLVEKSRFRVWLRHNPASPQPIGLVLKRPNKVVVTSNGIETVNILPRKMNPCTWERVMEYWDNPIGNAESKPEEMLNEFELSILDGVLTKDQKDALAINRMELENERLEAMKPKITTQSLSNKYGVEKVFNVYLDLFGGNEPENQDQFKQAESALK